MKETYIIAEAGVNHNGSEALAIEMIDVAKQAGANAVKFQMFHADTLTTKHAEQAEYQKKAFSQEKTQYHMLQELELTNESFQRLKAYAYQVNIDFIITPFDLESLVFISEVLQLPILKIGSGDVTHGPLLLASARSEKEIILSTGMSTLAEIEMALKVLAFGLTEKTEFPTQAKLDNIFVLPETQRLLQEKVKLLHCTTEYPAPIAEINLKAIDTLKAAFGLVAGFSDHSIGIEASLAAVARGAQIIEKHFTLDKSLIGPDHAASLNCDELTTMVKSIRNIEKMLGDGRKCPMPSEMKNINIARRSLVANHVIDIGEVFSPKNIGIKRPCQGLSPMKYWETLGKTAQKNYREDEVIL